MTEQTTDLLIVNARIRTMDAANAEAEAILVRGGEIVAVGARAAVEPLARAAPAVFDAGGRTVLPGFVDAHHHPSLIALWGGLVRVRPPAVTDIAGFQAALRVAAEGLPDGAWLVVMDWDEMLLDERRPPTRDELDEAVPDRPLLAMHYGCHRALANSRALELAGVTKESVDPVGGTIERDRKGMPSGLLVERAMSRAESLARASLIARDVRGFFERLAHHHDALLRVGITRVVDATVPTDLATLYAEAHRAGYLRVPTTIMPVSVTGWLETPWDALEGPVTGDGDAMLDYGPLKLVFDGAPACAMCLGWWQVAGASVNAMAMTIRQGSFDAMRTMLSVKPRIGAKIRSGLTLYPTEDAAAIVRAASERGFSVAIHAIGNEALDRAIAAFDANTSVLSRRNRPRIEHASFLAKSQVTRLSHLGACIVVQPHLMSLPTFASAPSVPGLRNTALRWLLDAGVHVAGSSDAPVAGFDPLDGIRSAVSRRTTRGEVYEPDQCVALEEALVMYTRAAAEAAGAGATSGTITAGKRADFVVLDCALDDVTLARARVATTILGGRVVYET